MAFDKHRGHSRVLTDTALLLPGRNPSVDSGMEDCREAHTELQPDNCSRRKGHRLLPYKPRWRYIFCTVFQTPKGNHTVGVRWYIHLCSYRTTVFQYIHDLES